MKTLTEIPALSALPGPLHLAVGFFDGVHLGHQEVIRTARDAAQASGGTAVVVTFEPHPIRFLRPEAAPRLLTSVRHKTRLLQNLGVSHLLIIPFDHSVAALTPEEFIVSLITASRPLGSIAVGEGWGFGKGRSGNLQTLQTLGAVHGYQTRGVPHVVVAEERVSSTRVRLAVERGDFPAAARLLGREYSVLGTVIPGRKLGRQLGFPTANLQLEAEQLPPIGVYAVQANVGSRLINGIANLGLRPTLDDPGTATRQFEVHLFDFDGDLYGQDMDVRFVSRIRDERKMESLDALKAQIARDVTQARAIHAGKIPA